MKNKLDCLKLINFIEKSPDFFKYILPCKKILIAYSGGQDSSALLAIFYILSQKWQFQIGVVYCNHNWTSSRVTLITIFSIIQNLDLPFYLVDSKEAIKPEQKARNWRYQAFTIICNKYHYELVLTGHTLSDCAETIIFHLCRGTGLKGVCSLKKFQVLTFDKPNFNFEVDTYFSSHLKKLWLEDIIEKALSKEEFSFETMIKGKLLYNSYLARLHKKDHSTVSLILGCADKSAKTNIFPITFFDPITYRLAEKQLTQKKQICSCRFVCSLFPNLLYSLATNVKAEIDPHNRPKFWKRQNRILCCQYNFQPETGLSYSIQQGLKSQQRHLSFQTLLNRKLKDQPKKTSAKYFFMQPGKICPLAGRLYPIIFFTSDSWLYEIKKIPFNAPFSWSINQNQWWFLNQANDSVTIYRPLIGIERQMILLFDHKLNLIIINDQSNQNIQLTRNFIRLQVLPLLKMINPRVEHNLYKFSQIAALYLDQTGHIELHQKNLTIFKP